VARDKCVHACVCVCLIRSARHRWQETSAYVRAYVCVWIAVLGIGFKEQVRSVEDERMPNHQCPASLFVSLLLLLHMPVCCA